MNILITGKNGYIATNLKKYFLDKSDWQVETVSVRDGLPSLEAVDVLIHTAALVHAKQNDIAEYDRVNRGLTVELAQRAKKAGVRHFIFISTMAVFGLTGKLGQPEVISGRTPCRPITPYGISKLAAEKELQQMGLPCLTILRPPMVYGPDCPGNYDRLVKLAKKTPVFPYVENRRSALHIEKLCELMYDIVNNQISGILHPQDSVYMNTSETVARLAAENGRKIHLSPFLGRLFCALPIRSKHKIFGSLVYCVQDKNTEILFE